MHSSQLLPISCNTHVHSGVSNVKYSFSIHHWRKFPLTRSMVRSCPSHQSHREKFIRSIPAHHCNSMISYKKAGQFLYFSIHAFLYFQPRIISSQLHWLCNNFYIPNITSSLHIPQCIYPRSPSFSPSPFRHLLFQPPSQPRPVPAPAPAAPHPVC